MKIRAMVLSCLTGALVLSFAYEYSRAEPRAEKPSLRIGVVSIRQIFQDSKRSAKYRQETVDEQGKLEAELEKLAKELEAEKAGLKTLKTGSSEHTTLVKEILTKQAGLQAQQKFYEQQMVLKEQRMIEELYKDILREVSEVAKRRDLDLVLEKSEPELPASSSNELTLAISTHKLLYSGGCLDVTNEVMAQLDEEESKK